MPRAIGKFPPTIKYIPLRSSGKPQTVVASGSAAQEVVGSIPKPGHTFIRRNKP